MLLHLLLIGYTLINKSLSACLDTGTCAKIEMWGWDSEGCPEIESNITMQPIGFCNGPGLRTWVECNEENTLVRVYTQQLCGSEIYVEYESKECYENNDDPETSGYFRWTCLGSSDESSTGNRLTAPYFNIFLNSTLFLILSITLHVYA